MDSLVCDLTNALNSKPIFFKSKKSLKNRKNLSNKDRKKSNSNRIERKERKFNRPENLHSSSSSDTKKFPARSSSSRIKHKKIMNLLLAAKASMRPLDQSANSLDCGIQNLVRLKQPNSFSSARSSRCQRQNRKSIKKSKRLRNTKVYKIQKIYRFHSNYRLHCLKLRRLQKKMLRSNHKVFPVLNHEKMSVENTTHSSSESTITTSPSYSSFNTTTDLESSSISDCYNQMDDLRINSDSDSYLKMRIKNQIASKKPKNGPKRKLLACRQRKNFNTSITSQSNLNLTSSQKKMLNFKRKRSKPLMNRRVNGQMSTEGTKTEYEDSNNEEINLDSDVENCKKCEIQKQGFVGLGIQNNARKIENEADDEHSSESSLKKEFECVSWWNGNDQEIGNSSSSSTTLNTPLSQTTLSNYQRLNSFTSPEDQKHFDEIMNGALDLMDHSSVQCFKNKIKILDDDRKRNRKKRFSFLSNDNSWNMSESKLNLSEPIIGAPIPENNLGNRMLKKMGWEPGKSLGTVKAQADPISLKEPIVVYKRPKRLGLGYTDRSHF